MRLISCLSLTSDVLNWIENSRHPRLLHVFDRACNLINERREVLSIVTTEIGSGPFNLVVENDICFSKYLDRQSSITISDNQLTFGDLIIDTKNAKLWSPRPDWESLYAKRDEILDQITKLPTLAPDASAGVTNYPMRGLDTPFARSAQVYSTTSLQSLISNLSSSLANADLSSSLTSTQKLAGLGIGLTPAGDDSLMGAIYAAWIIHPPQIAGMLAQDIATTAAPLTTSLSAAWLKSARKGEAGILWHNLFNALISNHDLAVQEALEKLLAIGYTSGSDALAGFFDVLINWKLRSQRVPP